ncbi:MAG: hypothetical protein LAT84_04275 [Balneolia bacterium]|nr:hypothetical protein [Balneolia bacterium]
MIFSISKPGLFSLLAAAFLLMSLQACSGTKNINSQRMVNPVQPDGDFDEWPSGSLNSSLVDEFDVAVANDDEYIYIGVNFRNNRTYRMARDHGFRIYIDSDATFRRSFGIVFPTGVVEALSDFPGARRNYLENPSWQNLPDNRRMVERAESQLGSRVQVIRRTDRNDSIRPALVSREQLAANGIIMGLSETGRAMALELRIPIDDGSEDYFSVIPNSNGRFYIDFEIEPMTYEQVTGEVPGLETVDVADNRDPMRRNTRARQELSVSNPQLYNALGYKFQARVRVTLDQ